MVLVVVVFLVTPNKDYIIVPKYEHQKGYSQDIGVQITVVPIREKSDDGKESVRYSVSAKLHGRVDENNADPKIAIQRFQMSALLKNNTMHYFTEQTDRTTPISHSYTISPTSSTVIDHHAPDQIFVKVNYTDKNGEKKIATFLEDVYLELDSKSSYTSKHTVTSFDKEQNKTVTDVDLKFIATDTETGGYYTSVWIDVKNLKNKHHVDLQTWIVTEDNRTLPFMSVYGYSDERNTFFLSNREAQGFLKPKELYARLEYYYVDDSGVLVRDRILYKESFENLPEKYVSTPEEPDIVVPAPIVKSKDTWIYIGIGSFVLIGGAMAATYLIVRRKKQEQ